jgi:Flp pilus assembly protein TadD
LAARHVAYAKVQEKLGNIKLMVQELEKAAELEPNKETFSLLQKAYASNGMQEQADLVGDRLKKLIVPAGHPKRIVRPRRVAI